MSSPTVLVVDIGGTRVKLGIGGGRERADFKSARDMRPDWAVEKIRSMTNGWEYDRIAIGFPGRVDRDGPVDEPGNLGNGWIAFDFKKALGKPVRIINDAVMQALGAYHGGRMLFIGLGTGVGSALITERTAVPLELGDLPYKGKRLFDAIGRSAIEARGEKECPFQAGRPF